MPKSRIENFLSFSVWSVRYSVRFDRYWVRGSWWTALMKFFGVLSIFQKFGLFVEFFSVPASFSWFSEFDFL